MVVGIEWVVATAIATFGAGVMLGGWIEARSWIKAGRRGLRKYADGNLWQITRNR